MAETKPFKLNQPSGAGITRATDGRFQRDDAVPPNPLEEEDEGKQPQAWAPGVGQGSADMVGQEVPWPDVEVDDSTPGGKPMRVS